MKENVFYAMVGDSLNFSLSEAMRNLELDLTGLAISLGEEIINAPQTSAEIMQNGHSPAPRTRLPLRLNLPLGNDGAFTN
ncbi:MAG: hypothetical protein LBS97_04080 [Treponema sp.]|jgi:hypothetical protein|nr:hypothetical protein [Treponema sp.]